MSPVVPSYPHSLAWLLVIDHADCGFSRSFPTVCYTPEGMKLRLDYCALVAGRLKAPPNPSELLEALCGGAPSLETRTAVARAESREQGIALLLMSPEMQRS